MAGQGLARTPRPLQGADPYLVYTDEDTEASLAAFLAGIAVVGNTSDLASTPASYAIWATVMNDTGFGGTVYLVSAEGWKRIQSQRYNLVGAY